MADPDVASARGYNRIGFCLDSLVSLLRGKKAAKFLDKDQFKDPPWVNLCLATIEKPKLLGMQGLWHLWYVCHSFEDTSVSSFWFFENYTPSKIKLLHKKPYRTLYIYEIFSKRQCLVQCLASVNVSTLFGLCQRLAFRANKLVICGNDAYLPEHPGSLNTST